MKLHPAAVEVLQSQKDALAQLLGALLFQVEEDATGLGLDGRPLDSAWTVEWARDFRKDLWARKPELMEAVRRHTYANNQNTHPGYALNPLLDQPTDLCALSTVYVAIDALAASYRKGVGQKVRADDFDLVFGAALIAEGHAPDLVEFALEHDGRLVIAIAASERAAARFPQDEDPR